MNENNDCNAINEELIKGENLPLPETLTENNVKELLKNEKTLKKLTAKTVYRRVLASVAVFAVVATTLFIMNPWKNNTLGSSAPAVGKVAVPNAPSDYTQIEKLFTAYQKTTQPSVFDYAKNIFVNGFKASADASSSAQSEEIAGSAANKSDGDYSSDSSSEHGETNEQVVGVSEGDIIKNDGAYLYMAVSIYGSYSYGSDIVYADGTSSAPSAAAAPESANAIAIIKPGDNGKMTVVGTVAAAVENSDLEQGIVSMYIRDNTLIAVYSVYNYKTYISNTLVAAFDITDKSAPTELWRFYQNGTHLSSRLIGDNLVLLSNYYIDVYNSDDNIKDSCIPETGLSYNTEERIPAGNICVMDNLSSPSYLVVTNINTADFDGKPASAAILGGGENVYCTTENLYVTNGEWDDTFVTAATKVAYGYAAIDVAASSVSTTVYSFDITGGVVYKAKATVDGTVLNQFSIDEYDGYLRLATTADSEKGTDSRVYVLDDAMKTVGTLKGLGTGERIQAVRFMGGRGYVVTFLQTDPLFVIDLSDPTAPKTLGELKITGFSSYLHPITDTLLIGIGPDGTDDGTNGALKVSLFDVSDPSKPVEADKVTYGNNNAYAYSAAYYDAKAICYDAKNLIFYFPMDLNVYYSSSDITPKTGAAALAIDVQNKSFGKATNYFASFSSDTSYASSTRVTYIGDTVFSFTDAAVFSFDKTTGKLLDSIDFYSYDFPDEATPRPYAPETTAPDTTAPVTTTGTTAAETAATEPTTTVSPSSEPVAPETALSTTTPITETTVLNGEVIYYTPIQPSTTGTAAATGTQTTD